MRQRFNRGKLRAGTPVATDHWEWGTARTRDFAQYSRSIVREYHLREIVDNIYFGYIKYTMEYEFDPIKSDSNKEKHGIDFYEAQVLWNDPDLIEIPVKTTDEPRFLVIGNILGKHLSGVITYRSEKIRIISVRRSRKEEVVIYES
ncbi:MAG: BrnT family toxin [Desulfomonilaceae bacterium]